MNRTDGTDGSYGLRAFLPALAGGCAGSRGCGCQVFCAWLFLPSLPAQPLLRLRARFSSGRDSACFTSSSGFLSSRLLAITIFNLA